MIRSAPSISTTGRGRALEAAEVGQQVGLAGRAQLLGALVPADLGEDVDGGRHCRVRLRERGRPARLFAAGPAGVHRAPVPAALYLRSLGPPAASGAPPVPDARQNAFFEHGDAQLFLALARRPRRRAASAPSSTSNFNAFHDNRWGMFGFLEFEDAPDVAAGAARGRRRAWLRGHGRDRMIGPMDFTMNDECGVLIEGYDRDAVHQAALAPAATTSGAARRPGWRRRWTCSCTSSRSPTAPRSCPIVFKLAEQVEPRHGITIRHMSRRSLRARPGPLRRGLQRGLERELGLRRPTPSATSTSTPRRCSSSSTATGSWSPRQPTARRSAVAITVPDINQVLRR